MSTSTFIDAKILVFHFVSKGVAASEKMAEMDAGRMRQHKAKIDSVAHSRGVDPALLAGIVSRESRAGNQLQNGWGDHGKAWGLMQVDVTPNGGRHTPRGGWDSEEHISQAADILVDSVKTIERKFPHWSKEEQLKGLFDRFSRYFAHCSYSMFNSLHCFFPFWMMSHF
uniref:Lysozyme g n=1 Tax=Salarias fasciatus TaxID=181472 RepID=A0A672G903_SALFA